MAAYESSRHGSVKQSLSGGGRKRYHAPLLFLLGMAIIVGALILAVNRGDSEEELFSFHHMAMDTAIELRFTAGSRREAEALRDEVFAEIERLEALLSRTVEDSDVTRINRKAGLAPVWVSPETMAVVQAALEYAALSGGAFDPTIAPLMDVWGFAGEKFRVPASAEIEAAGALVDYTMLEADPEAGTVFLRREGMSLDLGGIAKGYIVDRGMEILARAGVKHAFLNAGGDIGLLGTRPDGSPWRIGVRHPRETGAGSLLAVLPSTGKAVVTSGDYERVFEANGEQYHHILDPNTGFPARLLTSVTVVAESAMDADALSTAVFVMGPERGMALVEELPGVEAVLVTPDLEVLVSSGLKDIIELRR